MDNLSKEDIDHIFKKGTDKQEFPFKESAWDSMEQMLDKEDKKSTLIYYMISSVAALFIVIALFFGIQHFSTEEENQELNNQSNLIIDNKPNEILANEIDVIEKVNQNDLKVDFSQNKLDAKKTTSIHFNNDEEAADTKLVSNSNDLNKKVNNNTITSVKTKSLRTFDKKTTLNSVQNIIQEKNQTPEEYSTYEQIYNVTPPTTIKSDELYTVLNIDALPVAALNKFEYAPEPIHTKAIVLSKPNINRFAYRGFLAYESSSVREATNRKSGFKLGAEVAYQFGGKFQISSGLALSFKNYETAGTNYNPVQARIQWVDDVAPERVSGTTTVFEVPIEFTYYLKDYRQNGFFIGAGLNSFFLTREWYDFEFDAEYRDLNQAFWTTENNDNAEMKKHFLSVVSAQFGYQRQVSNKLAFQVAPFIQLPITGIGYGDVKLITAGIQFKLSITK